MTEDTHKAPSPRAGQSVADQIESALRDVDIWADDTPNLNAWPQPYVRREFAEWLAARITVGAGSGGS